MDLAGGGSAAGAADGCVADAAGLRRRALVPVPHCGSGQCPVYCLAVLAAVRTDGADCPLLHRHSPCRRPLGRGQLFCKRLSGHPHSALGPVGPGYRRCCGGKLPLCTYPLHAGGPGSHRGARSLSPEKEAQSHAPAEQRAVGGAAGLCGHWAALSGAAAPHPEAGEPGRKDRRVGPGRVLPNRRVSGHLPAEHRISGGRGAGGHLGGTAAADRVPGGGAGAGRGFGGAAQHCGHYERVLGRL